MNRIVSFFLVAIFAIFLGTQITEGFLLLPYWQSLPAGEFYGYYSKFGPAIGRFYTILTIVAAAIPMVLSAYCFFKKPQGLRLALISSMFTVTFVAFFYIYFKGANQQFLDAALEAEQLATELNTWGTWHWIRVAIEFGALSFLVLSLNVVTGRKLQ